MIKVTMVQESQLGEFIEGMNAETRNWTQQAARGECGWICSDCCSSFPNGMPDACDHGHQRCTEIIQRDKREALAMGNEPA